MSVQALEYPIAPTPEKIKGTILDAAAVDTGRARQETDDLFESFSCLKFRGKAEWCDPTPTVKDLAQAPVWQDGLLFGAYGGVTCQVIGSGVTGAESSRLRTGVEGAFDRGEHVAVEMALMEGRFRVNAAGAGIPGDWPAPTVLDAAAQHPRVALAIAEADAASNYNGIPTIHMPRLIASLLISVGALEWDGDVLRTKLGSKVAAGGGYDALNTSPAGVAAAAGERWLYVTGETSVQRGEPIIRQAIETTDNEVVILAERPYVATVDCYTAAVRATVAA